jgi:hypothetical protein
VQGKGAYMHKAAVQRCRQHWQRVCDSSCRWVCVVTVVVWCVCFGCEDGGVKLAGSMHGYHPVCLCVQVAGVDAAALAKEALEDTEDDVDDLMSQLNALNAG